MVRLQLDLRNSAASGVQPQTLKDMLDPAVPMQGKQVHLYQCDHLGTPLALMNDAGKQEWGIELDAWGKVLREPNPEGMTQPIRFQGQHWDDESGLYYNRHRCFDSRIGVYINQDPIGIFGGLNKSTYVSDPIGWVDPMGLKKALPTPKQKLPLHKTVWDNYPLDISPGFHARPSSDPGMNNQCAIRLSKALKDSGFDISSYPKVNKTTEGYSRSSKGLADWLIQQVGQPKVMSVKDFELSCREGCKGIFYEKPALGGVGHIDVINGVPDAHDPSHRSTGSGYYNGGVVEIWYWNMK